MRSSWNTGAALLIASMCAAQAAPKKTPAGKPAAAKPGTSAAGYRFEPQARPVLAGVKLGETRDPKLGMHASRTLHMVAVHGHGEHSGLSLFSSGDGGDTFEAPVPISEPGARVRSHGENSPSMVCAGGGVFVLWEQERQGAGETGGGSDLMFARSLMMGRSFEKPVRVTDKTTPSSNSFSSLSAGPNGDLYAAWLDGRDRQPGKRGGASVYVSRSVDRGATWSKNVRVGSDVCPCCRPTLGFGSQGEVFVSWRHVFPGNIRDMVVATSRDDGQTWGEAVRVAHDNWKIDGCPHTGAQMVTRGSRLYITWYSEGTGANPGVRLSWSDDGGASFAPAVIVSGKVVDTNHPMLALSEDGRILVVFQGRDLGKGDGWGPIRPYLVELDESGKRSAPVLLPGAGKSISYPAVLSASLGRLFIAWTEPVKDGEQVFLARGRRLQQAAN